MVLALDSDLRDSFVLTVIELFTQTVAICAMNGVMSEWNTSLLKS